jgi:hypothetical protein
MVTAPLSPSHGRGGRSGGLNHSFNNRGGPGRGLRGQTSPQSQQTGSQPDQQLLTQNQVNKDNPFHRTTTKVSDERVRNNPYEALQDNDDDSTAEVDNCEILDFHKENEQESIDDDSEVEIDFTQPQQTKGSPLPEHILTTPPRKQSKRKICSPAVETANPSVETDAHHEPINSKSPTSPRLERSKQTHHQPNQTHHNRRSYRIDTRLVKGQDYHLWKIIKQSLLLLVNDEWVFPNNNNNKAIQPSDITDPQQFDLLFMPKFLRRGHRFYFSMESPIDLESKMTHPETKQYFSANSLFISELSPSGKDFVCHSVLFGIQPNLVPRKAVEAAVIAHLADSDNDEVQTLFNKVKTHFHIFSKRIAPQIDGSTMMSRVYGIHIDPDDYHIWDKLRGITGPNFGAGFWAPYSLKHTRSFKESLATQDTLKRTTQVLLIQSMATPTATKYGDIIALLPHLKRQNIWMILASKDHMPQVQTKIPLIERTADTYEQTNASEVEKGLQEWATRLKPTTIPAPPIEPLRRKLTKRAKLPTVLLVEDAKNHRPWSHVVQGRTEIPTGPTTGKNKRQPPPTRNTRPAAPPDRATHTLPTVLETTDEMEEEIDATPTQQQEPIAQLKVYHDARLEEFSNSLRTLEQHITARHPVHTQSGSETQTTSPDDLNNRLAIMQDTLLKLVDTVSTL